MKKRVYELPKARIQVSLDELEYESANEIFGRHMNTGLRRLLRDAVFAVLAEARATGAKASYGSTDYMIYAKRVSGGGVRNEAPGFTLWKRLLKQKESDYLEVEKLLKEVARAAE